MMKMKKTEVSDAERGTVAYRQLFEEVWERLEDIQSILSSERIIMRELLSKEEFEALMKDLKTAAEPPKTTLKALKHDSLLDWLIERINKDCALDTTDLGRILRFATDEATKEKLIDAMKRAPESLIKLREERIRRAQTRHVNDYERLRNDE